MNDLKEIGGFIVSADPFVQHDNSLSGNGTVNSPLGVVPGYNETVLYSGQTTGNIVVNEPFSGFERIKLLVGRGYDNCVYNEFPGDATQWRCQSTIQAETVILNYSNYTISGGVSAIKNKDLRWTLNTNNTINYGGTTFPNSIWKVIGINRIANN